MRILLLNPPAENIVLRDYYCSSFSKANYLWHPIDLLAQSGWLAPANDVFVLDAVAERLNQDQARQRIAGINPEAVFALTSAATWKADFSFLERLKENQKFELVLSGEIFLDDPHRIIEENPFIDAALLNFTSGDLARYIAGERAGFSHLLLKNDAGPEFKREKAHGTFSFPPPRHELFKLSRYRMPWQKHSPFATVMTDFGCPFGCLFCNSRTMGYALRDIYNLKEELDTIGRMGIRQLFIKDMTFGAVRKHAVEVLELLIKGNYGFSWNAYTRSDLLDEELVALMSRAGCHLLQIGVESADSRLLEKYNKGVSIEDTERAFSLLKKHRIDAGAHFIIGLPGDTIEGIRKTAELAVKLNPAYASFNLAMPRLGTGMQSNGWRDRPIDSSSDRPFYQLDGVSSTDLIVERRRTIRRFYLRPRYWIRVARSLRTSHQIWDAFRQALAVLTGIII